MVAVMVAVIGGAVLLCCHNFDWCSGYIYIYIVCIQLRRIRTYLLPTFPHSSEGEGDFIELYLSGLTLSPTIVFTRSRSLATTGIIILSTRTRRITRVFSHAAVFIRSSRAGVMVMLICVHTDQTSFSPYSSHFVAFLFYGQAFPLSAAS